VSAEAVAAPVNILVVNPSQRFLSRVREFLEPGGHQVSAAAGVDAAVASLALGLPDLIVLEHSYLQSEIAGVLARVPGGTRLPIVFLTSPQAEDEAAPQWKEQLEWLEALIVHVKDALAAQGRSIQVGELTIDPARKSVAFRGNRVKVTPIQFRLLLVLASKTGEVVAYRDLLREVWGYEGDEEEARELLKWQVRHLRQRLGLDADRNEYIQSVRGFGYMLTRPTTEQPRMF
jgi:DNA-binding response OmpR family regulator